MMDIPKYILLHHIFNKKIITITVALGTVTTVTRHHFTAGVIKKMVAELEYSTARIPSVKS
jgi:hypothetical protein